MRRVAEPGHVANLTFFGVTADEIWGACDSMTDVIPVLADPTDAKPGTNSGGTATPPPSTTGTSPSMVTITGSGGLTFNLTLDSSVSSAPAGFVSAIEGVAQFFANQLKDPITV